MINKLRGTGVALVTPMKADQSLDFDGLSSLIDFTIKGGVDYLVLLGTTGESPTVNWDEKLELLDYCIDKLKGEIPLVFGLGGNNTADLMRKLDELNGRSIDAILSASPYYNKPSQEGIYAHYTALSIKSNFPLILYNVPHRTASNIEPETTLRLAEHENIIGIKEASGDLNQSSFIAKNKPSDFLLLSGDDLLTLPMLSTGADGVISVIANAYPIEFSRMVRAAIGNDIKSATDLHVKMTPLMDLASREGNPSSIKAALAAIGICGASVRLPLIPASDELIQEFKNYKF